MKKRSKINIKYYSDEREKLYFCFSSLTRGVDKMFDSAILIIMRNKTINNRGGDKMNKKQFYEMYVKDWIDITDKPANRMLWNNSLDAAHDDRKITKKQVNTWIYPSNKYFK